MKYRLFWRSLMLAMAAVVTCGGFTAITGCSNAPDPSVTSLTHLFPDQAAQVLLGPDGFTATDQGFSVSASTGDGARLGQRHGLHLALPAVGDGFARFNLPGSFEARVREIGSSREGAIAEKAVTYARDGGTSFWTATEAGYEEWLLLKAGVTTDGVPVAAWEIEGAALRQVDGAVEILDTAGVARLRVTAPAAYAAGGRHVQAKLSVRDARIELSVLDSRGDALLVDPFWVSTGSMGTARKSHVATLLADRRVLVLGGVDAAGGYPSTTEIFDPLTNTWSAAASMSTPLIETAAVVLNNDKVLVAGGLDPSGSPSVYPTRARLYDPATDTWSTTGLLVTPRSLATLTVTSSGKVLLAGGSNASGALADAEIYDPATNTWTPAAPMNHARYWHTATFVNFGLGYERVLVAGGHDTTTLSSAEVYDVPTNTWTPTGAMSTARELSGAAIVSGSTDKVMVNNGRNGSTYLSSTDIYNPTTNSWSPGASTSSARLGQTTTLLATGISTGKVLVAGGHDGSVYLASTETYDPATNAWTTTPAMSTTRGSHTMTLLYDGQTLVAGGVGGSSPYPAMSSSERFEPVSDTWQVPTSSPKAGRQDNVATPQANGKILLTGGSTLTAAITQTMVYDSTDGSMVTVAPMLTARAKHTATLLGNGKTLVVGGVTGSGTTYLATTEIYDPTLDTWTSAASASNANAEGTATLLTNGKVLVVGCPVSTCTSAELYDPSTNTWSTTGTIGTSRTRHIAVTLSGGNVLIAGGFDGHNYTNTAEIYDPATNTWTSAGTMATQHSYGTAALLPNGDVLVAGGFDSVAPAYTTHADLYNPTTGWSATGSMSTGRGHHVSALLPTGKVLVVGGHNFASYLTSAELYDPTAGTWGSATSSNYVHSSAAASALPDGRVLVVGGYDGSNVIKQAEVYAP